MAEITKRTTTNSSSKSRKSKNDIIRSTLGMYLKQNNYSMNEKFRKSDLALTQTLDQYDVMMMLDDDVAKVNSILYSNVLCLSNNQSTVEFQFSKFVKFVQSQSVPVIKSELQTLLWPLLCHIYVEMIKGRDSRPAAEFLRKYAHLIGPIDNLNETVTNELNGQSNETTNRSSGEQLETQQQCNYKDTEFPLPSSTTKIVFATATDQTKSESQLNTNVSAAKQTDIKLNSNNISDYFMDLVQSLSLCLRIDEIESIEITRNFRSAKYEMVLSLQSLYAMKHFLAKSGHVIILHILQNWFSLDIREFLIDSESENDEDTQNDINMESSEMVNNSVESNGIEANKRVNSNDDSEYFDFHETTNLRLGATHNEIRFLLTKVESEIKTMNRLNRTFDSISDNTDLSNKSHSFPVSSIVDSLHTVQSERQSFNVVQNKYLQNVRASVIRSRKLELPIRVFNLINTNHQLSSCDIDKNECHLVCGFHDSTIKLWQLNQSKMRGKKPFSPFSNRLCEWCLDNCESDTSSSSSSSDNDSDDELYNKTNQIKRTPITGLFVKQKSMTNNKRCGINVTGINYRSKRDQKREFMSQRCESNIFSDGGCVTLYGHCKGVTDVLFSKYNPLIFSVSKDNTMRAWKAVDYCCGAVYRGHNYPIWCVAESSTGLYLATGSRDLTAKLWSTDREHPLQTYIGHTQDVDAIAFHPNGNYIATASSDLTVRLWDVTSGQLLRVFIDCHLPVHCLSFSPDGRYLAAAGEETKIRIFDLAAGSQVNELKDHSADVNSIEWNSNSSKLASCCADGSIRVYSVNKTTHNSSYSLQNSVAGATPPTTNSTTNTTTAPTPITSSSLSSPSNSNSNKLMISNETGCRRAIKVFFNFNDTISCIGDS